jgi:hypothetical protein
MQTASNSHSIRKQRAARKLTAGDGADDEEGLGAGGNFGGKRRVGSFEGEVFRAGEKAEEGPALQRDVIADRAAEHRVAGFESVQDGTLGDRTCDFEMNLAANVSECAEMSGERYTDHGDEFTSG